MPTVTPAISVVIPAYQSVGALPQLLQRINQALQAVPAYEVIFVDDGSPPETWSTICQLAAGSERVRGLRLSRNYGQHAALLAGIRAASFPITVTLDDDLQNPPEAIPALVTALAEEQLDIVYGVPVQAKHSACRRLASRMNHAVLSRFLSIPAANDLSSFRAFRTELRQAFANDLGTNVSIDALLSWASSSYGSVEVEHHAREDGKSGYSLRRLVQHAMDILTGYSSLPLHVSSTLGAMLTVVGFGLFAYVLVRFAFSGEVPEGFTFLAATISLFAGAQFLVLGVLGEYLARMHFRIMGKPTYLVIESTQQDGSRVHYGKCSGTQTEWP